MDPWVVPRPLAATWATAPDGVRLSVRQHGNPDSTHRLPLSHGCGLAADMYAPFWSELADSYEIVVYDMRSHGRSNPGALETLNVPTLVADSRAVFSAVQAEFGSKPTIGVFHSLSAIVALLHAAEEPDFAGLVLFDPPVQPTDGSPADLESVAQRFMRTAEGRRDTFQHPSHLAHGLARSPVFRLMAEPVLQLFAEAALIEDGDGWRLRCPPAHEAQLFGWLFGFTMQIPSLLGSLPMPVKVIGADPAVQFSFLPTVDMSDLIAVGYDFVPDHTHFLQLENPELTAAMTVEFLDAHGLA